MPLVDVARAVGGRGSVGPAAKGRCDVCRNSLLPRRNPGSHSKTLNCRRESPSADHAQFGTSQHTQKGEPNQSVTALISWHDTFSSHIVHVFYVHVTVLYRNNFLFNKTNRRTNFPNLFCQETLHVSASSSAHHQEFSTVHSALVYVMQV
jgi:hypothetical protein